MLTRLGLAVSEETKLNYRIADLIVETDSASSRWAKKLEATLASRDQKNKEMNLSEAREEYDLLLQDRDRKVRASNVARIQSILIEENYLKGASDVTLETRHSQP